MVTNRATKQKEIASKKRGKAVSRFTVVTSLVFIVVTLGLSAVVYLRYSATENWQSSQLTEKMADIPPEFAKNTYSLDVASDMSVLASMSSLLKDVDANSGLPANKVKSAKELLDKSKAILEKHNIEKGEVVDNQHALSLYLSIYDYEKVAYEQVDTEKLNALINELTNKHLKNNLESDSTILSRLGVIGTDYTNLTRFVDTYVPQMGYIRNGVVEVNEEVSQPMTEDMLHDIESMSLDVFPNIKKLETILTSKNWSTALATNDNLRKKEKWEKTLSAFRALSKHQYLDVSKLSTLRDARNAGLTIQGDLPKDGYELLDASPITSIVVDGTAVGSGYYVRKGSNIVAVISPTYKTTRPITSTSESEETTTAELESETVTESSAESVAESEQESQESQESVESEESVDNGESNNDTPTEPNQPAQPNQPNTPNQPNH